MDPLSQKRLDEITEKEILALTDAEKLFLKARRDYLNKKQLDTYAEVLEANVGLTEPPTESVASFIGGNAKLSYRDLQRKAKTYGLPYIGISRESLLEQLSSIEGPVATGNPE